MVQVVLQNYYVASVSGGKDSLYMLKVLFENRNQYPLHALLHCDLEIDYPVANNVIDYMEKEANKLGLPMIRVKPIFTFNEGIQKYGYPTRKARWCNKWKLSGIENFRQSIKSTGKRLIQYIGYCYDEDKRFKINPNTQGDFDLIYPLAQHKIKEEDVLNWARNINIFGDYYLYNKRMGCMFCPMQSRDNLAYLKYSQPDIYNQYMKSVNEYEEKMSLKLGRPFSVWHSIPKYNTKYMMHRAEQIFYEKFCKVE